MASSFSWVDFAEDDRRKMMEILHLFHDKEIREELGVGTVRDAFSDMMFPGTSTLNTRAKYMLFIPWIFLSLEKRHIKSDKIEEKSREYEISLIRALLNAGEDDGVIGRVARDRLKILPSYMYWSGLGIWGIRRFEGSNYQYFQSLDSFYAHRKSIVKSDDGEAVSQPSNNWDPNIVAPPNDFPWSAKLDLSREEATYLHDRILARCKKSLLAFLVTTSDPTDVRYAWIHPNWAEFSDEHKQIVQHARNFSDVMHGASLLYNLMLSEKRKNNDWIEKYTQRLVVWADNVGERFSEIAQWDLIDFWRIVYEQNQHINYLTRRFIDNWIGIVRDKGDVPELLKNEQARRLIYQRELRIKGNRSRLKNERMLEQWLGAAGENAMDFRWRVTQRLLKDIFSGLKRRR